MDPGPRFGQDFIRTVLERDVLILKDMEERYVSHISDLSVIGLLRSTVVMRLAQRIQMVLCSSVPSRSALRAAKRCAIDVVVLLDSASMIASAWLFSAGKSRNGKQQREIVEKCSAYVTLSCYAKLPPFVFCKRLAARSAG